LEFNGFGLSSEEPNRTRIVPRGTKPPLRLSFDQRPALTSSFKMRGTFEADSSALRAENIRFQPAR
jgi:hypothetical protein